MPITNRKLRVFLSYAKEDINSVHEMYNRLKNERWIEPWQDEIELLPGDHWTAAIRRAIDLADVVIIFLSDNSINKEGFVHYEMNYAWERSLQKPPGTIYRIPIRLDDCDIPEDLYELDSRQWVDYFDEKKDETYEKLLIALKQRLEQRERHDAKERYRVEKLTKKQAEEKEKREREETEVKARQDAFEKVRKKVEEKSRLDAEKVKQAKILHEDQEEKDVERVKAHLNTNKVGQTRIVPEKILKEKTTINNASTEIILNIAAVVLCAFPGLFMCLFGAITATGNGTINDQSLSPSVGIALVCVALIFILIPVAVGFFTMRKKPEDASAPASNDQTPPAA